MQFVVLVQFITVISSCNLGLVSGENLDLLVQSLSGFSSHHVIVVILSSGDNSAVFM